MIAILLNYFDSLAFIPHGHCYLWKPGLVWLHVLSDGGIAFAYFSVSVALVHIVRQRQDFPYPGILQLFGAFIIACGTTHAMEIWTLWHPDYWASGLLKSITATISLLTAATLVPVIPEILSLPSRSELEAAKAQLEELVSDRTRSLRLSEERLQLAVQSVQMGVWEWDIVNNQLRWDDRTCELFNIKSSEVRGYETWESVIHPDDLLRCRAVLQQALIDTTDTSLEFRTIQADNTIRHLESHFLVQRDSQGQALRMIGVNLDITERKQAEAVLKQSEHDLRTIFNRLYDAIFIHDLSGAILDINNRALEMFGVNREQMLSFSVADLSASNAPIEELPYLFRQANAGEDLRFEWPSIRHPNKTIFDSEVTLSRATLNGREICIATARDISDYKAELRKRQQAEAALQQLNRTLEQRVQERTQALQQQAEQERLLRLIIQNIHRSLNLEETLATVLNKTRETLQSDRVAIYQFSSGQSIEFVAESVAEGGVPLIEKDVQILWEDAYLLEKQDEQLQNNIPIVVNDIYVAKHSRHQINQFEVFQIRAYVIIPVFFDGQLWGLFTIYQNFIPRGWQVWEVSLLQQIVVQTAIALRQSRLYEAAQEQVHVLEELSHMKDDFLSTVSHELRSPLTNIKMAIQMIQLRLDQQQINDEHLMRYVQILEDGCTQELNLVNDLLDLQRLEAGVKHQELEHIDLNYWLPSIAEAFESRVQQQQQQLNIDIPQGLPSVVTDLAGLKRILMELLHNACKYTPPHEEITLAVQVQDAMLQIQVSNSGVELPPQELPRLFEKFYRFTSVDRWRHGGTGLGLALVKRLVEYLQGSIQVESANSLTCFTVQLPLKIEF
ncbi:PAS domain S-box protein [Oscillatoria sp. FACHB-1407]|uniref:sensor histidine kinase n=1 Tax=Oscillatoria sp. FACHB-1407 TaxID=2692847 RepID=UPI001686C8B1|nr:ATP-binding protein [Oscillatoria sp. FACHB-1407]MBD2465983.1 PAS domain S-box protein [Oscillatoria sp. FACHB-1407]